MSAVSPVYSPSQNPAGAHGSAVLVADGIRMAFGVVVALDKVSISVGADELLAVIGPNGAGKTSLMNCLSGFYRPQQGEVRFNGAVISGMGVHNIVRAGLAQKGGEVRWCRFHRRRLRVKMRIR